MEQDYLERIVIFIRSIGINIQYQTLEERTFLPGLLIDHGSIIIDRDRLQYPGDLLHEAGHIATVPARERAALTGSDLGTRNDSAAEEMMAIAWSYAACRHLNIDPYFVFHESGYMGAGKEIADQFNAGNYFGVPMLQWTGMTANTQPDDPTTHQPYPAMIKWMRDV